MSENATSTTDEAPTETPFGALEALDEVLRKRFNRAEAIDLINDLQNRGLLFRLRGS